MSTSVLQEDIHDNMDSQDKVLHEKETNSKTIKIIECVGIEEDHTQMHRMEKGVMINIGKPRIILKMRVI